MGYRTGRHSISEKAWRKLEHAEALAGLKSDSIPASVEEAAAEYLVATPLRTAAALAMREHGDTPAGQTAFDRHRAELRAMRDKAERDAGGDLREAMRRFDDMLAAYLAAIEQRNPPSSP